MVSDVSLSLSSQAHSALCDPLETVTKNPIWWHYLCITVPHQLTRPDTAFMLIDGGSNLDG